MEPSDEKMLFCRGFSASNPSTYAFTMCGVDWLLNGELGAAVGVGDVATPGLLDWKSGCGLVARDEPDLLADLLSAVPRLQPPNCCGDDFTGVFVMAAAPQAQDRMAPMAVESMTEFDALVEYLVDYWLRRGSELLIG